VYAFTVMLSLALLAIGSRSSSSVNQTARTEIAAGGMAGCGPKTLPVTGDVTQIILSCGGAVLTAVEKGATTFEEIVTALQGSTCGTVTVAEVEQIVQLFMGPSPLEGGTLPLDIATRVRAPEMQTKLKALHHK
jgi:hypothetical protein